MCFILYSRERVKKSPMGHAVEAQQILCLHSYSLGTLWEAESIKTTLKRVKEAWIP